MQHQPIIRHAPPPAPTQIPVHNPHMPQVVTIQGMRHVMQPGLPLPSPPPPPTFYDEEDWSKIVALLNSRVIIPPESTLLQSRHELKDIPARAVETALREITPLIDKSLVYATSTVEALLVKDFVTEEDPEFFITTARTTAENLATSLCMVHGKDSFERYISAAIKKFLPQFGNNSPERLQPIVEQMIESVLNHNVDVGLSVMKDMIRFKIERLVDEKVQDSYHVRVMYMKNKMTGQPMGPFLDTSRPDLIEPSSLERRNKLVSQMEIRPLLQTVYKPFSQDVLQIFKKHQQKSGGMNVSMAFPQQQPQQQHMMHDPAMMMSSSSTIPPANKNVPLQLGVRPPIAVDIQPAQALNAPIYSIPINHEKIRSLLQFASDVQKHSLNPTANPHLLAQFRDPQLARQQVHDLMSTIVEVARQTVTHLTMQPLTQLGPLPRSSPVGVDMLLPSLPPRAVNAALSYLTSLTPTHELQTLIKTVPNFLAIVDNEESQLISHFHVLILTRVIDNMASIGELADLDFPPTNNQEFAYLEVAVVSEVHLSILAGIKENLSSLVNDITKSVATPDILMKAPPAFFVALARYGLIDLDAVDEFASNHLQVKIPYDPKIGCHDGFDFFMSVVYKCFLCEVVSPTTGHQIFPKTLAAIENYPCGNAEGVDDVRSFQYYYIDEMGLQYKSWTQKKTSELKRILKKLSSSYASRPAIAIPRLVNNFWLSMKRRFVPSNKLPAPLPASVKRTPVGLVSSALSLYRSGNCQGAENVADPTSPHFIAHTQVCSKFGTYQTVFVEWTKVNIMIIERIKPFNTLHSFFSVLTQRFILNLDMENIDIFFKASVVRAIHETATNLSEYLDEKTKREAQGNFMLSFFLKEKVPIHIPDIKLSREAKLWLYTDALVRLPTHILRYKADSNPITGNTISPNEACILFSRFCHAIAAYAFETGATCPTEIEKADSDLLNPVVPLPDPAPSSNSSLSNPVPLSVDSFHGRIIYRIITSFVQEVTSFDNKNFDFTLSGLRAVVGLLCEISPANLPNFSVFWLGIISNSRFINKMLGSGPHISNVVNRTWPYMARLISITVSFLAKLCADADNLPPAAKEYSLGVSKLMTVLAKDFKSFVAQYAPIWVPWIPPACTHLRNILNSTVSPGWNLVSPDVARQVAELTPYHNPTIRRMLPMFINLKNASVPSTFWNPLFIVNLNDKISLFFNEASLLLPKPLPSEESVESIVVLDGRLPKITSRGYQIISEIAQLLKLVPPVEFLPPAYVDSVDISAVTATERLTLCSYADNPEGEANPKTPIFPFGGALNDPNCELSDENEIRKLKLVQLKNDGFKTTEATGFTYDRSRVAALVTSVVSDHRGLRNQHDQAVATEAARKYVQNQFGTDELQNPEDPSQPIDILSLSPYGEGISPSFSQPSYYTRALFAGLLKQLDAEGRYVFAAALVDGLKFPCLQTHAFMAAFLHCFTDCIDVFDNDPDISAEKLIEVSREGARNEVMSEDYRESLHEILIRALFERLVTEGPHPWGVVIALNCLLANKRINITARKFLNDHPHIAALLEDAKGTVN